MNILKHELKMNFKTLLIWLLNVGGLCFGCVLLYGSLKDSLAELSDAYSSMGNFSVAFGMDRLDLSTLTGFYATEIGVMFSLGGAMYAAILGSSMLSKEESGHTAEFLFTMPCSRASVISQKLLAMLINIAIFHLFCIGAFACGFVIMGEQIPVEKFLLYHLMQFLMQFEIASVCFLLSSLGKKSHTGSALGITIILYCIDMMCRIIPAIKNLKYITPFYYSNGSDIFSTGKVTILATLIGLGITILGILSSFIIYEKRDLAA